MAPAAAQVAPSVDALGAGGMFAGHYVAHVKHCEKWMYISDSHMAPSSEAAVLRSQAYILFYTRDAPSAST